MVCKDESNSFIQSIHIREEVVIPSTMFCLSNLKDLHIDDTPFKDGKFSVFNVEYYFPMFLFVCLGIVPDNLGNLKTLESLFMCNSSITKMTEQLGTLTNLTLIQMVNCSLTSLPNLSKLKNLKSLTVPINRLSHIDGLYGVSSLQLARNRFNEMPKIEKKENLIYVSMSKNALKSFMPFMEYKNLEALFISNSSLTFIPSTIDKLQNLKYLALSRNNLSSLPTNVLNLPQLIVLDIRETLISKDNLQSIKKAFEKSHPALEIYS